MMKSIRTLLNGMIDYAGLFPPAALDMDTAIRNYDAYRRGDTAWALGRFVVPVARLEEFEAASRDLISSNSADVPWRLSVLGADPERDGARIEAFNARRSAQALIDTIEVKAASVDEIARWLAALPEALDRYVEIPIDEESRRLIDVLGASGGRAKVRSGGVTPDAFPTPADLLRFIAACIDAQVPFKATAGLHHPLRGAYRLTYADDAPAATMYGFLNVFLTAAFLLSRMSAADASQALLETSPTAFRFDDDGVTWRGHRLSVDDLARTRRYVALSFGSCSFSEPIDDLKAINLL